MPSAAAHLREWERLTEAVGLPDLPRRWLRLVGPFAPSQAVAEDWYKRLTAAYSEPGRHYHNLEHVRHVLAILASEHLSDEPEADRLAAEFAAWFHDAIYDARAKDNEERSADLARQASVEVHLPAGVAEQAAGAILLTKMHGESDSPAIRALLDADLAILGAPAEVYRRYAQRIRREYEWVADADYRAGRSGVLEGFLDRPRIYRTRWIAAVCEDQARRNLKREINDLKRRQP